MHQPSDVCALVGTGKAKREEAFIAPAEESYDSKVAKKKKRKAETARDDSAQGVAKRLKDAAKADKKKKQQQQSL